MRLELFFLNSARVLIFPAQAQDIQTAWAEAPLDPQFAVAMIQFLRALREQGFTVLYHAGFHRDPMSPGDGHAKGMAVDITGFMINGVRIDLRSGDPRAISEESHSDWFDTTHFFPDGRSHRQVMFELTHLMARFFTYITGPGRSDHYDHFHVEIRATGRTRGINAPATPTLPFPRGRALQL